MTNLLNDQNASPGIEPVRPLTPPTPGPFAQPPTDVPTLSAAAAPHEAATPPPSATPAPPFPPPEFPLHSPAGPRRVLGAVAALGVVSAVAMGLMWSSASSRADDADTARLAAEGERDLATERRLEADVEIQGLQDEVESLRDQLAAVPTPIDTTALETKIEELNGEIERLTTENLELAAASADAGQEGSLPPAVAVPFDPALTPEFTRYMGRLVSSRGGQGSVLGPGQSECFGAGVIATLGLDGLGAGLADDASAAAKGALEQAMQSAAIGCGIDPSAVFG